MLWRAADRRAAEATLGMASDIATVSGSNPNAVPSPSTGPVPGSTLLNSTDPYFKEYRDLPYYMAITR